MKVKNLQGTTNRKCNCKGGWLGHWREFTNCNRTTCCAIGCSNKCEVGAHVKRELNNESFIVPFCHTHNRKWGEWIEIEDRVPLAPGNKKYSCESGFY